MVGSAAHVNDEQSAAMARGIEQANVDCERGLLDLERSIAGASEFTVGDSPSRSRILSVKRASLVGMYEFLRVAMERQRQRDAS
jgi:hypothetical protein